MIYFISKPDRSAIKIGTTIRLTQRLKQLAAEHGDGLEVLAVVDGNREAEYGLHQRFAHLRIANEWFEPGDDLMGFIVAEAKAWDGSDDAAPLLSAKLPIDVIEAARIVSAYRNESITDLLGDILRPILAKMEKEEVAKRAKPAKRSEGTK